MPNGVNERFDFSQPLPALDPQRPAHVMAIAGSGMSGVARLLRARGVTVSGSDAVDLPVVAALEAIGCRITIGYSEQTAQQLPGDTLVAVSSAIREDNPELEAVRGRGLTVLHRAQTLGMLMAGRDGLAVAGANGKTTTSAMAVVAMHALGLDPSFAIGADILGLGANAGVGQGEAFVVEADESDGSFVVYHPQTAVVTSVRPDHLDFYGTVDHLREAFERFVDSIRSGGLLVACADDPGSRDLAGYARTRGLRVITYGWAKDADVRLTDGVADHWTGRAQLAVAGGEKHDLQLEVPGLHNLQNAAGVVAALVGACGIEPGAAVRALSGFAGVARRLERIGSAGGVNVVDDYAHNQDKASAAVAAARAAAGDGRLIVVFQPHLYSRTRDHAVGLAQALSGADLAIVLDIYGAREAPMEGITSALITDRITAPHWRVHSHEEALAAVLDQVRPGDLVLTMGAGDVTRIAPQILQHLTN